MLGWPCPASHTVPVGRRVPAANFSFSEVSAATQICQGCFLRKRRYNVCLLACCYRDGTGIAADESQFLYWLERAAYSGNEWAILELATGYATGFMVEENMEQAKAWYQKAPNSSYANAMLRAIACSETVHNDELFFLPEDHYKSCRVECERIDSVLKSMGLRLPGYQQQMNWRQAALMYELAQLYELCYKIQQELDPNAADHLGQEAQGDVGRFMRLKRREDRDWELAMELYETTAAFGLAKAIHRLEELQVK